MATRRAKVGRDAALGELQLLAAKVSTGHGGGGHGRSELALARLQLHKRWAASHDHRSVSGMPLSQSRSLTASAGIAESVNAAHGRVTL